MANALQSVIPCDGCEGHLVARPGRGLVCANGCDDTATERSKGARPGPPQHVASTSAPVRAAQWEIFDPGMGTLGASMARLQKNGQLIIGVALATALGETDRVELRYDRAGQRIGIAPTTGRHGVKLHRLQKGRQVQVSVGKFLAAYGMKTPPKPVPIAGEIEEGVLVLPAKDIPR